MRNGYETMLEQMREIGAMIDLVTLIDQEILTGGGKTCRTEIFKIGLLCRIQGLLWLEHLIFKTGLLCLIRLCRIQGPIWLEGLPTTWECLPPTTWECLPPTCLEYPQTTIWVESLTTASAISHLTTIWAATTIMGCHPTCHPTTIMQCHPTTMGCHQTTWEECHQTTWEERHQTWEECPQTTWEEDPLIQDGLITCLTENTRIATLQTWGLVETLTHLEICQKRDMPKPPSWVLLACCR